MPVTPELRAARRAVAAMSSLTRKDALTRHHKHLIPFLHVGNERYVLVTDLLARYSADTARVLYEDARSMRGWLTFPLLMYTYLTAALIAAPQPALPALPALPGEYSKRDFHALALAAADHFAAQAPRDDLEHLIARAAAVSLRTAHFLDGGATDRQASQYVPTPDDATWAFDMLPVISSLTLLVVNAGALPSDNPRPQSLIDASNSDAVRLGCTAAVINPLSFIRQVLSFTHGASPLKQRDELHARRLTVQRIIDQTRPSQQRGSANARHP